MSLPQKGTLLFLVFRYLGDDWLRRHVALYPGVLQHTFERDALRGLSLKQLRDVSMPCEIDLDRCRSPLK